MKHNNLIVLGASGETGKWVAQMAIERGHNVTALVRSKELIEERDGLEITQGDVSGTATIERAVEGKDAILSCLGIRRKAASNPFSPLLSPIDFTASCAPGIVNAMKTHGVARLIATSAAGAGDSRDKVDPITRLLFRVSKLSVTLGDSENMEEVYANSGLAALDFPDCLTGSTVCKFDVAWKRPFLVEFTSRSHNCRFGVGKTQVIKQASEACLVVYLPRRSARRPPR